MKKENKSPAIFKGYHRFITHEIKTPEAERIERTILEFLAEPIEKRIGKKAREEFRAMIKALDFYKKRDVVFENDVVKIGRKQFALRLASVEDTSGNITHGALGSSSVAVDDNDEQLGNETERKPYAVTSMQDDTTAIIEVFFSRVEANATHEEYGTFIDGTEAANSGTLYSRFITGGWEKVDTETLTVISQLEVNQPV